MSNRLYEELALVSTIDPQTANNTTVTGDWVSLAAGESAIFILSVGTGDCTVAFKLQEATSNAGAGNQDLSGKAITTLAATDDNKQAIIEVKASELSSGFTHVAPVVTVSNATGMPISVVGLVGQMRYSPASAYDLASVAQIVY